jgi:hypothetical protein
MTQIKKSLYQMDMLKKGLLKYIFYLQLEMPGIRKQYSTTASRIKQYESSTSQPLVCTGHPQNIRLQNVRFKMSGFKMSASKKSVKKRPFYKITGLKLSSLQTAHFQIVHIQNVFTNLT